MATIEITSYREDKEKTKKKVMDTLMDGVPLHPGSKSVLNPQLSLFNVPPTDLSMSSHCIIPIQTYTTGINPVEFQVDPQEDYVDLSRSFFKIELALKLANGDTWWRPQDSGPQAIWLTLCLNRPM